MNDLPPDIGIILVDHGSTHEEANAMLLEVAQRFRDFTGAPIVEIAHMELASPTVADAFTRCVEQGAKRIVVHPYFLAPGQHSTEDIPRLAEEASKLHGDLAYRVTEPLGIDDRIAEVIAHRIYALLSLWE